MRNGRKLGARRAHYKKNLRTPCAFYGFAAMTNSMARIAGAPNLFSLFIIGASRHNRRTSSRTSAEVECFAKRQ
jgi:hypothetical protein